jgi:hypothetical protein
MGSGVLGGMENLCKPLRDDTVLLRYTRDRQRQPRRKEILLFQPVRLRRSVLQRRTNCCLDLGELNMVNTVWRIFKI